MERAAPRNFSMEMMVAIVLCLIMVLPSSMGAELAAVEYDNDVLPVNYPNANGSNVNSAQPEWGQAGTLLGRVANSSHDPSTSWMGLADLPNAREISNIVCAQPGVINDERGLSDFNWLWGQFITHEIDFTLTQNGRCLLYTSPSPRDRSLSRMPSSA